MDYENLYSTLKALSIEEPGEFGQSPHIDFDFLVDSIREKFGKLERRDFIVAANFTHYNQQLGGLNRLATLIEVDSFEPRDVRSQEQVTPGKKYVVANYCDMVLAFQVGEHIASHPADLYIFITGDKSFAAVASSVLQAGKKVLFILPNPETAAVLLKRRFPWAPFSEVQPAISLTHIQNTPEVEEVEAPDPYTRLRNIITTLRREFSTAVPVELVKVILGYADARRFLERARSEEVVDLWRNEEGVECISLRQERLVGNVVKMNTRPALRECARVLAGTAQTAAGKTRPASRADWRKELKNLLAVSNTEAKEWLDLLFELKILQDARMGSPDFSLENVIQLVKRREPKGG